MSIFQLTRLLPRLLGGLFMRSTKTDDPPAQASGLVEPAKMEQFFSLPYCDRQLVLFVDDAVIEPGLRAEQDARAAAQKRQNNEDKKDLYWETFQASFSVAIESTLIYQLIDALKTILKSFQQARKLGVDVRLVGKGSLALFSLPPGHPRDGVIYVGHPAIKETYVPLVDFHRSTFEHKFSEVVSLLMHLGARHIEVEHVTGWGKEFAAKLDAALPVAKVGVNAQLDKKVGQTILYTATLQGHERPTVPEGLVWYPHEPTWKQVAEGSSKFGLKEFALNLQYHDDYGVNADLKLEIEKSGFDLGGKFEAHQATTWRIQGTFGEERIEH